MTEGGRSTGDAAPAGDDEVAPFASGTRVSLCQYAPEGGTVGQRELGVGVILVRPRVGERLELRIRAERGLASSPVRELRLLGERCLAVATFARVYVLNLLDGEVREPKPGELLANVREMLANQMDSEEAPGEVTEYVRIDNPLVRPDARSFAGRTVRIERTRIADPDATPELLGTGRLLADPEPGLALRFQDDEGQVVTTSAVVAIERGGPEALEACTINSRYRFAIVSDESA